MRLQAFADEYIYFDYYYHVNYFSMKQPVIGACRPSCLAVLDSEILQNQPTSYLTLNLQFHTSMLFFPANTN